jgi:hypothetical protein
MDDLLADGRFVDVKSQIHKDMAKVIGKTLAKDRGDAKSPGFSLARLCRV